jgi:hypothetical protein
MRFAGGKCGLSYQIFVHSQYPFTQVELDNRDFDKISAHKFISSASAME